MNLDKAISQVILVTQKGKISKLRYRNRNVKYVINIVSTLESVCLFIYFLFVFVESAPIFV